MSKIASRLHHVLAVARLRSFSRAAEELNISQSALSRSISGFEDYYGVRLFERGRAGVVLTAAGSAMIEEAQTLARATRTFERNLGLLGKGDLGKIAVGVTPLIASLLLPTLGVRLMTTRSQVQLKAEILPTHTLMEHLFADAVEIVFGPEGQFPSSPEIAVQSIGAITLTYLVRSSHPLAGRDPISRADLEAFPTARTLESPSAGLPGFTGSFVCDNYNIMREVVLGSDTVWLTCPQLVADDLESGRLVELSSRAVERIRASVAVASLKGRTASPLARQVISTAQNLFTA